MKWVDRIGLFYCILKRILKAAKDFEEQKSWVDRQRKK